jgi:hypothetical protein
MKLYILALFEIANVKCQYFSKQLRLCFFLGTFKSSDLSNYYSLAEKIDLIMQCLNTNFIIYDISMLLQTVTFLCQ